MTIYATSKTHDEKYCGHFLLRRVAIEIDRPRDNFVTVTFATVETEFATRSLSASPSMVEKFLAPLGPAGAVTAGERHAAEVDTSGPSGPN